MWIHLIHFIYVFFKFIKIKCNRIKIIDFGIAGGSTISTDDLDMGTLCYMPPEVLEGKIKKLEPSIDVWGMGIILFC